MLNKKSLLLLSLVASVSYSSLLSSVANACEPQTLILAANTSDATNKLSEVTSDTAITAKIKAIYLADKEISVLDIKTITEKGVVSLEGKVHNEHLVNKAVSLAKSVHGVKKVKANLKVDANAPKVSKANTHTNELMSDTAITAKIKAKFMADDTVKALDIHVKTNHGVVNLTGNATNKEADHAISLVNQTEGVNKVNSELKIVGDKEYSGKSMAKNLIDDTALTTRVKAKLLADENVSGFDVHVETKNETVILYGVVTTQAAADKAIEIAKSTEGVNKVESQLKVDPNTHPHQGIAKAMVNDTSITTKIKAKLLADEVVSGFDVHVETKDGVVNLNGIVATQTAADRAVAIAKEVENVKRVNSELKVGS